MILLYLVLINLTAFAAMGWDKSCAERGVQRIPERTLLTLAVLGGAPGAIAAQHAFRHKTRKQPFEMWLYGILAVQVAAAGYIALAPG
ncbi:DUF1294 domain-containing protein [Phenylobacterium sp.]|uniref:DUF1294 domain-containing protein n=1 Tax=Phenylobacterium sp. TaxID=1871053 RepID=UPI002735AD86|nr:DUF1294 domain-containing protein [Phenylobacterium sp.]MDP3852607.1 DUF1294 domain-containing protein [Phenylobacterium sp.]